MYIYIYISGQITIMPKLELGGFGKISLTKPPFGVTSAEVVIICSDIEYVYIYINTYVTLGTQLCLSTHPWSVLTIGQRWRNIHLYTQEHEVQENQQPVADSMAKLKSYALKKPCLEDDPFHQRDGHQASKKWKWESPSSTQPSVNSGSSSLFLLRVFMQLV